MRHIVGPVRRALCRLSAARLASQWRFFHSGVCTWLSRLMKAAPALLPDVGGVSAQTKQSSFFPKAPFAWKVQADKFLNGVTDGVPSKKSCKHYKWSIKAQVPQKSRKISATFLNN